MAANQAKRRNETRLDAARHPRAAAVKLHCSCWQLRVKRSLKTDLCLLFWARIERIPGGLIIKAGQASKLPQLLAQRWRRVSVARQSEWVAARLRSRPVRPLQAALGRMIRSRVLAFVVSAASEWQGARPRFSSQAKASRAQWRQDAGAAAGKKGNQVSLGGCLPMIALRRMSLVCCKSKIISLRCLC